MARSKQLERAREEVTLLANPEAPQYQVDEAADGLIRAVLDEFEQRCLELADGLDKNSAYVIGEMRREHKSRFDRA